MVTPFLLAGGVAFGISFVLCALLRKMAARLGLVDRPGFRKIHQRPMPVGGGLGIWLGVLLPIGILFALAHWSVSHPDATTFYGLSIPELLRRHAAGIVDRGGELWTLLGLGSILVVLGTLDDRFHLGWKLRLGVETLVAITAVAFGWEGTFFLNAPILTKILSVLWIVGLTNSFNLLDNMDGLSSGVAIICASFLATVFLGFAGNPLSGEPQLFLGGFLLLLVGAILGFWVHNVPPARLFMGDGGAYFIGFLLATTTLSATFAGKDLPRQAILTPLCVLAVPLYDTVSVILIRLRHGKSPFEGDNNHYSHRLVEIGLSKRGAVLTIYLTTAICGISALFLYQVDFLSACLIVLQVLMILGLVGILEFTARNKIHHQE